MAAGKRLPGFCASLAALLVLLFFFSATYLLWVALILTVAVIASALLLKADARRLQLEMTISGGRVGQQVSLRLHSRLAGSILLSSAIVAELEVSSVLPDRVEKLCLQLPLQALRDDFETTVTARLSGETRVRCLSVQLTDPLGLFLARCAPCRECRTVFYPQPVALQLTFSEDALSAGTTEEMVRRHRGNDPSETFDVRDYVPGDDVRSIHWKLSGKMDTLIVRQASDSAHYDTVLLPDLGIAHRDSTCPTDAEFNSAVAVTMALCEKMLRENRYFCLAIPTSSGIALREVRSEREMEAALSLWLGLRLQEQSGIGLQCFLTQRLEGYFTRLLLVSAGKYDGDLQGLEQRIGVSLISTAEDAAQPAYAKLGPAGHAVVLPACLEEKEVYRIVC